MLVTTYQHDYVPPHTKRYEFMKTALKNLKKEKGDATEPKEDCVCEPEVKIEPPKSAQEGCEVAEWTGIAPMGRLIDPRIIPTKFSPDQIEGIAPDPNADCFQMQPNRFLKILRTAYPDLYERLRQMPKDELNRRLERQRLYTTYQIDFCNMNEYPEGVYESLKEKDDTSKINASKLLYPQGPCSEFRANAMKEIHGSADTPPILDPCEKLYKPFKISFEDSTRFVNSGNNSHWRSNIFHKRANFTEYMDTVSKNGCIIMRNNIHDHSKCLAGKYCRHQLVYTCPNTR